MALQPVAACCVSSASMSSASARVCRARWPGSLQASHSPRQRRVACAAEQPTPGGGDGRPDSSIEDLFAEELKRRRLQEGATSSGPADQPGAGGNAQPQDPFAARGTRTRAPPPPRARLDGTEDQRQRSMSMVNEGLEGLLPRASQLIQLGGSVFLAFLPFMLAISLLFSGIYMVFGESFVHRGTRSANPPVYIDPERLLSETTIDPYVPFDR